MLLPLLSVAVAAPPLSSGASTEPLRPGEVDLDLDPAPVVGGTPVPPGRWPDAVALFSNGGIFACSGVLIAPDAVLTAGHCQFALETVLAGTTDLRNGSGEPVNIVSVTGHEDYTSTYDVALVRLERPITTVAPRLLAVDCVAEDYVHDGADVTIVGFGATDLQATRWTSSLNEARTTVDDADCSDLSAGCYSAVSPGGEVIAGGGGVDSCVGDSGGPLYLDTPQGAFLLGTTSRAAIPADTVCGDGGIYVRSDAVVDWIEAQLGYPLERPTCEGWNHLPRPLAEAIEVPPGGFGATVVDPGDPDDDAHAFEIVEGPEHGEAQIDADGGLLYAAPLSFRGEDRVVVRVTDDGEPPLSGELEVPIRVGGPDGTLQPRGCSTVPGAGGLGLLGLGMLARRRRSGS